VERAGFVAPFQGSGTAAIDWALDCVVSLVRKGGRTDVQPIETIECVDIGCGDGRVAVAAARRGFHATGIDIDDTLLMHAAESARM
jgi:2-polyprenyl-3-methyl-5-hydroxy-6-metoxy-1,4-benzoquinol methylase